MKKNISHPKKCAACNKAVTRGKIQYDYYTLKAYCNRPTSCKPELRPKTLIDGSDGLDEILEAFPYSESITEQLREFIPKSHAFRSTPEQALYLVKYAHKHDLTNVNQIIQHVLDYMLKMQPLEEVPARNPIKKGSNSGFLKHTQSLKEEIDYYKEAAQKLEPKPKPILASKPKQETKKNIAFRL